MMGQPAPEAQPGTQAASVTERCPYRSGALMMASPSGKSTGAARKYSADEGRVSRFVPDRAAVSARSLLITRTQPKRGPPVFA